MPDEVKKEALKELGPPGAPCLPWLGLFTDAQLRGVAGVLALG